MQKKSTVSARELAATVLMRVEVDRAYSHVLLGAELERTGLSPADRRLATRLVYGTLARQRPLDAELERALDGAIEERTDPWVRACLRSALFQMRYLDRVPQRAAVHEAVELVKRQRGKGAAGFTNAILRRVLRSEGKLPRPEGEAARFGLEHSVPDDVARRVLARWGETDAARWAEAINQPPPLVVRVNRSRASVEDLATRADAQVGRHAPAALRVAQLNQALDEALAAGACAIQDEGSQLVVHMAAPLPAGTIWDACAGQGGKTLHILDMLAESGTKASVLASDLHEKKLRRLQKRASTLFEGAVLETQVIDVGTPLEEDGRAPDGTFDLVLVDAPCSGLGLMRRHPEMRWRYDQETITSLAALQRQILQRVAPHVHDGGLLVYAVCTDTREETDEQVDAFLAEHPEFAVERPDDPALAALLDEGGRLVLSAHEHDTDGFFVVRMRKRSEP